MLDVGLRRTFRWVFLIADVRHTIIGVDFLHHLALVVDLFRKLLLDISTNLSAHAVILTTASLGLTILRGDTDSS